MAISVTRVGSLPPQPADQGIDGVDVYRCVGDGAATTITAAIMIAAMANSPIKRIMWANIGTGVNSVDIPLAGVLTSTNFTTTFGVAPGNGLIFYILVGGKGTVTV